MSTKPWWEQTWSVEGCGNPKHGPDWGCHRVVDDQGQRVIGNVDLATATRHAAAPDMARALMAELEDGHTSDCIGTPVPCNSPRCQAIRAALTKAGIPLP